MNFYTSGYAIIQAPEMFSNLFTWVASKRKRKISCTGTGKTSTKQMDANEINYPKKSKIITICSPKNSKKCVVKGQGKAHADKEISEVIEQNVETTKTWNFSDILQIFRLSGSKFVISTFALV